MLTRVHPGCLEQVHTARHGFWFFEKRGGRLGLTAACRFTGSRAETSSRLMVQPTKSFGLTGGPGLSVALRHKEASRDIIADRDQGFPCHVSEPLNRSFFGLLHHDGTNAAKPTRRRMDAAPGKIPVPSLRLLISPFRCSIE